MWISSILFIFALCVLRCELLLEHHFRHVHNGFLDSHRRCSELLMSSNQKVICMDHSDPQHPVESPCKAAFKERSNGPKVSWFVQCMAKGIVEHGFQMPVFVVHDANNNERLTMMQHEFENAGILNESLTWVTQFQANQLTAADRAKFPARDTDEEKRLCGEIMPMRACSGTVTDSQMSCGLKHMYIIEQIAQRTEGIPYHLNFSLVIEDDQILPTNFLQSIVELLLQAPDDLGIVMLDDSFFDVNGFNPPVHLRETFLTTGYARNRSRTTGSYLISQRAAAKIIADNTLIPAHGPIDHQLEHAIQKSEILSYWVIPPLTCAGSQGILKSGSETGGHVVFSEQRVNCKFCCNHYYNASGGWTPFQTLEIKEDNYDNMGLDAEGKPWANRLRFRG